MLYKLTIMRILSRIFPAARADLSAPPGLARPGPSSGPALAGGVTLLSTPKTKKRLPKGSRGSAVQNQRLLKSGWCEV